MAGQARRGTRGAARSSRGGSSWPVLAAASAGASGSATGTASRASTPATTPELLTSSTYRSLLLKGLSPAEAANLTAFLAGIHVGESTWTLRQVNQLLFLRAMHRTGHVGGGDDPRPH